APMARKAELARDAADFHRTAHGRTFNQRKSARFWTDPRGLMGEMGHVERAAWLIPYLFLQIDAGRCRVSPSQRAISASRAQPVSHGRRRGRSGRRTRVARRG